MHTLPKLAALLALGMSSASMAQRLPPQVWIPPEEDLKPIVLDDVRIDVSIRGFLAHTRIEMTFANPNARVLEGEFVFPLGPGQTISGYALEVDGAMRQGVVVPKQTARVGYEETTRQRIDPGLAELTQGNVFRTRLYPIPANGSKRVAVEFEQLMDDAGSEWRYLLPLQFRGTVRRFAVTAEAPLDAPAPEVIDDSPDAALHFERAATAWRAELSRENIQPQRELSFRIPKQRTDATVLEAPNPLEPSQRAVLALIDTGRPDELPSPPKPRRVALYVDASGSANDRDREREHAALAAWLASLGEVDVEVVAFRDDAEPARRLRMRDGDTAELIRVLHGLPLDGASNYGAIDFRTTRGTDVAIVIGDGLDTVGRGHIDFSGAPPRLYALHAAQRADHNRLADIARRGSAEVIDLTRASNDAAVAALSGAAWRLLEITGDCDDLGLSVPQPVGKVFAFSATCASTSRVRLVFGRGDGTDDVVRELHVGEAAPASGTLADAVWRVVTQARIAQLESRTNPDAAEITRLAVAHGVVTTHTSLLVLDRIEDYVRHDVAPKEPELRAQFETLRASQPKSVVTDVSRQARLESLARRWQEFRQWHEQRHPWLETLLLPAMEAELTRWKQLQVSDQLARKQLDDGRNTLDALTSQSRALVARWLRDGAEPDARNTWEREAAGLMLRLDALRQRRLELAPSSSSWNEPGSVVAEMVAPMPAPSPMPGADIDVQRSARAPSTSLDRIEVTGTRIESSGAPVSEQQPSALQASIALSGWNPDTPYLDALRDADDAYAAYLTLRTQHVDSPSFFLDVADFFRNEVKNTALALRVLSNLAEIGDENTALVRVYGYRLVQWGHADLALRPLEEALRQRPEEPQSHRDLALALTRLNQPQNTRAAELLWHIAMHEWHGRFPDIDLIALHELTALLAANPNTEVAHLGIPPELLPPVTVGLRVVLTWDADNTDIDLWVIDPTGEAVYYAQPRSKSGGHVSRDFTQGYGPEVFTIARPLPGTYRIQAHYFGDRRQSLTGPVTVQLEFQTAFGSSEPVRQATTRRLESGKQRIDVGQFRVEPR